MDKALIDAATQVLAVEAVFLRGSSIRCKEEFMPQFIEDGLSLVPQYRAGPTGQFHVITTKDEGTDETAKTAMFYFAAGVRLIDNSYEEASDPQGDLPEDAEYVEIEAEFCTQYNIRDGVEEEEIRPALEEFGRYNVGYHVWPYWREYVQSVCARMGIPPIPVPMYRIPQPDDSAAKSED
jgi:hypothetical protein